MYKRQVVSAATGYTLGLSRGPAIYILAACTMVAFAVTSLDSATKTLVNDAVRLIGEKETNSGKKPIEKDKLLNRITYGTIGTLGGLNLILLLTGFPRIFTIILCLVFAPFFVRVIVYTFRFAVGKIDYSKSGTITEDEYKELIMNNPNAVGGWRDEE